MPTVTVCKGCGSRMMAVKAGTDIPSCVTCIGISPDSGIPIEVDVCNMAICSHCKQEAVYHEEDNLWHIGGDKPRGREGYRNRKIANLPFYDSKHNTYYCGCWGWD